jgi:hypothetical protein
MNRGRFANRLNRPFLGLLDGFDGWGWLTFVDFLGIDDHFQLDSLPFLYSLQNQIDSD